MQWGVHRPKGGDSPDILIMILISPVAPETLLPKFGESFDCKYADIPLG